MSSGEQRDAATGSTATSGADGGGNHNAAPGKKPYVRPETVELGSVTKLTAGGSGGVPEGMSGMTGKN